MAETTKSNRRICRIPQADAARRVPWLQLPDVEHGRLLISQELFDRTLAALLERSDGRRESAGIWAGLLDGFDSIATALYLHHELCDDRGSAFSLELTERAKFDLYRELAGSGLKLIALIHTHPENWVGLSPIDEQNQICSRIGFWSLVVPWYGRKPWRVNRFGVHLRSDPGWYRVPQKQISNRIIITKA